MYIHGDYLTCICTHTGGGGGGGGGGGIAMHCSLPLHGHLE